MKDINFKIENISDLIMSFIMMLMFSKVNVIMLDGLIYNNIIMSGGGILMSMIFTFQFYKQCLDAISNLMKGKRNENK